MPRPVSPVSLTPTQTKSILMKPVRSSPDSVMREDCPRPRSRQATTSPSRQTEKQSQSFSICPDRLQPHLALQQDRGGWRSVSVSPGEGSLAEVIRDTTDGMHQHRVHSVSPWANISLLREMSGPGPQDSQTAAPPMEMTGNRLSGLMPHSRVAGQSVIIYPRIGPLESGGN